MRRARDRQVTSFEACEPVSTSNNEVPWYRFVEKGSYEGAALPTDVVKAVELLFGASLDILYQR